MVISLPKDAVEYLTKNAHLLLKMKSKPFFLTDNKIQLIY